MRLQNLTGLYRLKRIRRRFALAFVSPNRESIVLLGRIVKELDALTADLEREIRLEPLSITESPSVATAPAVGDPSPFDDCDHLVEDRMPAERYATPFQRPEVR